MRGCSCRGGVYVDVMKSLEKSFSLSLRSGGYGLDLSGLIGFKRRFVAKSQFGSQFIIRFRIQSLTCNHVPL